MQQEKNKLLQICGILMIIGGSVGTVISIIAIAGMILIAGLAAIAGVDATLALVSTILLIVSSIVTLIAGITGVKNAGRPENASKCITIGFINIAVTIVGNIVAVVSGDNLSPLSLVTGLVLPALFLLGAYQNKGKSSQ